MKKKRKTNVVLVLLIVTIVFVASGCGGTKTEAVEAEVQEKPVKVAIIFPGSIRDMGWSQNGYEVMMELRDKHGLSVSYQENVKSGEIHDVLRNYASDGFDLIIGHELYFSDPVFEVADEFPDVMFTVTFGYQGKSNVAGFSATNWENTYLAGVLAGKVSRNSTIGILTATDSPIAKRMVAGFRAGAQIHNPDARVIHAYVGSWDDVVKGKELVRSMVNEGVDVIYTQCGQVNVGAVEAAQEAKIYAIGSIVDMSDFAPDTVLASAISPPGELVRKMVEQYLDGTLEGGAYRLGVKDGVEDLKFNPRFLESLDREVLDDVNRERDRLIQGLVKQPEA